MIDLPHDLTSDSYSSSADSDRSQIAMIRAAIAFAAEAASEIGMSAEAFSWAGKVNAAATEKGERHLEHYTRHLESLDEPFEWLDAEAMRALTGIAYYRRGLSTPGAALIQPAMFVRAMAEAATAASVDLYERTPVTALSGNGNSWYATTPLGVVSLKFPEI